MKYLNSIVNVINNLRSKGLLQHAAELDHFLRRNAQELGGMDPLAELAAADPTGGELPPDMGGAPTPEQAPQTPEASKVICTLYYQFEKWHAILDRELPKFDYFGKQNIAALRSALVNVHKAFDRAMQNKPRHFDKQQVESWNREIDKTVEQMRQSQQAKLDPVKAIVDANLLYSTTNRLSESCKRISGKEVGANEITQEFSNLMHVFANIIKSTSEQVAGQDLTKVR